MKLRNLLILLLLVYPCAITHAQVSTEGRFFWASFMEPIGAPDVVYQLFITSKTNTTGTVSVPLGAWAQSFTVMANQTTVIILPKPIVEVFGSETILNKGIYISALADISVYAVMKRNAVTEASLVLPTAMLGNNTEYIVQAYAGNINLARSEFVIVATKDDTDISITPAVITRNDKAAGVPFTIQLDSGQVYQVQSKGGVFGTDIANDLSGSYIKGINNCKPFVVFSGTTITNVPFNCVAPQHLYEQNYPLKTWGKDFILVPFAQMTSGYVYKIVASKDNTTITINTTANNTVLTLDKGKVHTVNIDSDIPFEQGICINANQPICIAQFSKGINCNGTSPAKGDPAMLLLNPIHHTIKKTTFNTISTPGDAMNMHFVNVIVKNANIDKIKLQDMPVPAESFLPIEACTGYSYAMIDLVPYGIDSNLGTSFTMESDSSFIAYLYGYGNASAYAYSVGASFENQLHNFQMPPISCAGTTLNFAGFGENVINYTWNFGDGSPPKTGQTVTHAYNMPGTYEVRMTVTLLGECSTDFIQKSYIVASPPNPTLGNDIAFCPQSSKLLNPNNATTQISNPTYQWFKNGNLIANANLPTLTINQSGLYKVQINQNGGCFGIDEIQVSALPVTTPTIKNLNNQYCLNSPSIPLEALPTGGEFKVNGNTTTIFNPSALGVGNHQVLYTYTNPNSCISRDTLQVIVNALPTPNIIGLQDEYCAINARIALGATPLGGQFFINNQLHPYQNIRLDSLGAGNYTLQYIYTNSNNCSKSIFKTFKINSLPALSFINLAPAYCIDASAFSLSANPVGGLFTINGIATDTFNPQQLGVGNHTISYTFKDGKNCTNTQTQMIAINALPAPVIRLEEIYCKGHGAIELNATPTGGIFSLLSGNISQLNSFSMELGNHEIFYTYQDINGCKKTVSTNILIEATIPQIQGVKPNYCVQNAPILLASMPTGGTFKINGMPNTNATFEPAVWGVGKHFIQYNYTSTNNCKDSTIREVNVYEAPPILNYTDLKICSFSGDTLVLDAGVGISYSVNNALSPRNFKIIQAGKYHIVVQDSLGCITTSSLIVAENCNPKFYMPNSFTPNGDGLNDILEIFGEDFYNFEIQIFNRWGERLFISNRRQDTWNGNSGEKPAPAGVYVCKIKYRERSLGTEKQYIGFIHLIR